MKSELLAKSPLLALPIAALFVFLAVFAVIVVVTMKRRAASLEPIARLPLDDEEQGDGR